MNDRTNRFKVTWLQRSLFRLFIFMSLLLVMIGSLYLPRMYDLMRNDDTVLNLYTFAELIDFEVLKEFEQKTGISVNVKLFESNEEMLAKFRINKGEGYDLVTPSDYMVELMHRENLLQALDLRKLSNYQRLDKRLLNKFFDPGNLYSLPLSWAIYGLGYSRAFFGENLPEDSWSMVFDPPFLKSDGEAYDATNPLHRPYKICAFNDVRDMVFAVSLYLWGKIDHFSAENVEIIREMLVRQKSWVESYTRDNIKYFLLSTIVPIVVTDSGQMKQIMDQDDTFRFIIPREGSFLTFENIAIPISSKKQDAAHKLIDFLLSRSVQVRSFNEFGYNPSNMLAYEDVDPRYLNNRSFFPSDEDFKRLHLSHNRLSLKKLMNLWIYVKCV